MEETALPSLPAALDLAGIAVFALTGAIVAARQKQTFVTMAFFALVTGVGGGTVRDLLIEAPVFWVQATWVAPVCLAMALLVWFVPEKRWPALLLEYSDAAGLAAYSVFGTLKALAYGVPPGSAVLMGIITGCVGGIIRDVVAGRPSIIMRPELYVTAAAVAAALSAALLWLGLSTPVAAVGAALAGFALRAAAIRWSLSLPSYRLVREDEAEP